MPTQSVTFENIQQAYLDLKSVALKTSLEFSPRLSQQFQAEIFLKREDLQIVRSYKLRGAYNLMKSLTDVERKSGVVCASAGNHAQGVAYTCKMLDIEGHIYMPQNTPRQKLQRVSSLGGSTIRIELVGDTFDETQLHASEYARSSNRVFVHPFDDARVITGQGTIGVEIAEQLEQAPDFIVAPLGGGGLISGLSVYAQRAFPGTVLVGAEPAHAACMIAAIAAGHPVTLDEIDTFIDGASVKTVGQLNYTICSQLKPELLAVSEGSVCTEMIALYQNDGIIAEPAGALSIAALPILGDRLRGKRVVCVVSGGNNDITRYPEVIERSLIDRGLKHYFLIEFAQRTGALRRYLDDALGPNDDITLFEYIKKSNREFGPALVGIELARREDYEPLLDRMNTIGLRYEVINSDSALFRFVL